MKQYDKIIIGAGLYGLYAALFCGKKGQSVLVLECDLLPFSRATYINQARVHQGYHYPRSISTALKSAGYFERFNKDYSFCINREFDKVYATSKQYSWADGEQFKRFCKAANIPCEELHPGRFFNNETYFSVANSGVYDLTDQLSDDIVANARESGNLEGNVIVTTNPEILNIYKQFENLKVYLSEGIYFIYD